MDLPFGASFFEIITTEFQMVIVTMAFAPAREMLLHICFECAFTEFWIIFHPITAQKLFSVRLRRLRMPICFAVLALDNI